MRASDLRNIAIRTALTIALAACQPQSPSVEARSQDGRLKVEISRETLAAAFNEECANSPPLPCDKFERYQVRMLIDREGAGFEFVHDDVGHVHGGDFRVLPIFTCGFDELGPVCSDGSHREWQRPTPHPP